MTESASPESGALSVEQAVASLIQEPVEQQASEAPAEAADEPEENTEGESNTPEDAGEAEEPGDSEEAEQPEAEAEAEPLKPPQYWTKEEQETFTKLDRDTQEILLRQEGKREQVTSKAKAEAAESRQAAQKEVESVKALAERLATFLPDAIQTFQRTWGEQEPDWENVIEQYGAEEAAKLQARFNKEQKLLIQTAHATQAAADEARKAELQEEWARLAELEPDLVPDVSDPTKGLEKRQEVTVYAKTLGYSEDEVRLASARDYHALRKAMLWDRAQAALKAAPKPKPAAPAQKAPVRPAAAAVQLSPMKQQAATAKRRFAQTGTIEDAVALLSTKG